MTLIRIWSELMSGRKIRRKSWSTAVYWKMEQELIRNASVMVLREYNSYFPRRLLEIPLDYLFTDDWEYHQSDTNG